MFNNPTTPTTNAFSNTAPLPIPKLNLQYLTLHDYLLRNFELFRLESSYDIRQDVEDVVRRMGGIVGRNGNVEWTGWARMGSPISRVSF